MVRTLKYIAAAALGLLLSACGSDDKKEEPEVASELLLKNQTIQSAFLKREMSYTIYLPEGTEPTKAYPFLYLLHGYGDNQNAWADNGTAVSIIRSYVAAGGTPMVVVMPDGLTSFYTGDWESYFYQELMPELEKKYKCSGKRAVAGLSMGGYGTLYHALSHPTYYTYAYAMSPAVFGDMTAYISAQKDKSVFPGFTIEIGTGDTVVDNSASISLAGFMNDNGVSCELVQRVGAHTWDFWRECLPKALDKAGASFK